MILLEKLFFMYIPQRDKTLNTSKNEVRNDGTCS
jgi:hypothetical protein